jgi:hypothetical protein
MPRLTKTDLSDLRKRGFVIITIQLLMAMVFIFRPASHLSADGYLVYQSYFADLVMPFSFLLNTNTAKKKNRFLVTYRWPFWLTCYQSLKRY